MRRLSLWAAIFFISAAIAACAGQHRHGRRKGSTTARGVNAKVSNDHESARLDLQNLNAEQGKATYQNSCINTISLDLKASDKAATFDQIVTKQAGRWQLVDIRAYATGKNVTKQIAGQAHGPFSLNGANSSIDQPNGVTCHTNNSTAATPNPVSKDTPQKATPADPKAAINMEVKFPNEIQTNDGKILSFAQLVLQARESRVGAQVRLTKSTANDVVSQDNDKNKAAIGQNASLRTVRILDPSGRLIMRLSVDVTESDGTQYTNYAEATYELKP